MNFSNGNKIMVKRGRNYYFVLKDDICLIRSERNYSRIICGEKNFIVRNTLSYLEKKLGTERFMRVNRSTIVNIDRIEEMKSSGSNDYIIVLKNKEILAWGRRYRERIVREIKV